MTTQTPLFEDGATLEEIPPGPTWPPAGRTGEWWMFWQEDHPNTPPVQLLGEAMAYFCRKYGVTPNKALVPSQWDELLKDKKGQPTQALPEFPGLRVLTTRTLWRGELWLTYFAHDEHETT